MTITLSEAYKCLASGAALSWDASGTYKAGTINLDTPGKDASSNT